MAASLIISDLAMIALQSLLWFTVIHYLPVVFLQFQMATTSRPRPPSHPGSLGLLSVTFTRFRNDDLSDSAGAFALIGTMETFVDARIDLLQRRLSKTSDRLKLRAFNDVFRIKHSSREVLAQNLDQKVQRLRLRVRSRFESLPNSWKSSKAERMRGRILFLYGVLSVLVSALMFGMAPEWVHIFYTVHALFLLPLRAYSYKKRDWHYFLFDLCYYCTFLNLVYIWLLPASPSLFTACYCLSHGSLATATIAWRDSLVFHAPDKLTTLFVHMYAPFTFTVIRHVYPGSSERFPALNELPHLSPLRSLLLNCLIYMIWQTLYWKFVYVNRRSKVESGQRLTSLTFILNDKRSFICRYLTSWHPQHREMAFMGAQLVHAVVSALPAVFVFYDSSFWSGVFLFLVFSISAWNGGGYYMEVFGRKFERELEALRKEFEEATARHGTSPISDRELVYVNDSKPDLSSTKTSDEFTESSSKCSSFQLPPSLFAPRLERTK